MLTVRRSCARGGSQAARVALAELTVASMVVGSAPTRRRMRRAISRASARSVSPSTRERMDCRVAPKTALVAAGLRGFLLKDTDTDLLLHAIDAAAEGDALIAPNITARLLTRFANAAKDPLAQAVELTDREREIIAAVARGHTNAEIANDIHLSLSGVKAHIGNIMDKVGARNPVQVAIWAHRNGHTDP